MSKIIFRDLGSVNGALVSPIDLTILWKPYITFVKLLGLMNCDCLWTCKKFKFSTTIISLAYAWLFIGCRFFECGIPSLNFSDDYLSCELYVLWVVLFGNVVTTFFFANHSRRGFRHFFKSWMKLKFRRSQILSIHRTIKRQSLLVLIVFIFVSLFNVGGESLYQLYRFQCYVCRPLLVIRNI